MNPPLLHSGTTVHRGVRSRTAHRRRGTSRAHVSSTPAAARPVAPTRREKPDWGKADGRAERKSSLRAGTLIEERCGAYPHGFPAGGHMRKTLADAEAAQCQAAGIDVRQAGEQRRLQVGQDDFVVQRVADGDDVLRLRVIVRLPGTGPKVIQVGSVAAEPARAIALGQLASWHRRLREREQHPESAATYPRV